MTISLTSTVNESVKFYFQSTTGLVSFPTFTVINDAGLVVSPVKTITEIGSTGYYCVTLTPSSTGKHMVGILNTIIAYIDVVAKSLYTYLRNIEDESIGSWTWDKQTGVLTMLRQDASDLASFNVIESLTNASRERI